jgi:polyisoprenoid-binding protein YceI
MKLPLTVGLAFALGCGGAVAAERRFAVDAAASNVAIHVGKAGMFKFAGHEHEVLAPHFSGEIVADADELSRSSVSLTFESGGLAVSEKGEPSGDAPKVQAKMLGPDVLDAVRFPSIAFRSTAVKGKKTASGGYELSVEGQLTLHGLTKPLTVPVQVELAGETLTASGRLVLRHTTYGMSPVSVAGVVKVKDELGIDFKFVAHAAP